MFSWKAVINFHIPRRTLFYPRTYNVSTPWAISVATVTLNLILVSKVLYSPPTSQVKFRREGWASCQPTASTAWITLTSKSDMFGALCGKLRFMRSEKKTASRFHVNVYLGEMLGHSTYCSMIHFPLFSNYQVLLFGAETVVAKGHLSQMWKVVDYQTKDRYGRV